MLEFLKGELRTVLAVVLLLLIFVGLGFAADTTIVFDFGTGLSSEVDPGAISVAGGVAVYPQTSNNGITFGWQTPYIAEQSSGAQVADLLETDSNQGVGNNMFKVSGLASPYYTVTLISGNLTNSITTKVVVNNATYIANSEPGQWKTLTFKVAANAGKLDFDLRRYGTNLWAVNAITLIPSNTPPADLSFDVSIQPTEHMIQSGGTAVYRISIIPNNGYSSEVDLSIADLPSGMTAAFTPVSGIPPMISNLEISTQKSSASTRYTLNLVARGKDIGAYTVNKNLILFLTAGPVIGLDNITEPPVVDLKTFQKQATNSQRFIDKYITAEEDRLLNLNELASLHKLSAETAFASMPELPQPRSIFDASLRQLTGAGIIGIVVDSAPVAESTPPPQSGFWTQFFGSMFNPAQ